MPGLIGLVDRLRGEPEMLAHIFRRLTLQMRHFAAKARKMLVHAPHGGCDPAEAAFDEHDRQLREALGDTLDDEACELRRHGVRVRLMLLDVIGRPAAPRGRVPAIAPDMDAE